MKKIARLTTGLGLVATLLLLTCVGVWLTGKWLIAAAGIPLALFMLALRWQVRTVETKPDESVPATEKANAKRAKPVLPSIPARDKNDPAYLASRMLEQGRYPLLLRPQIAANLQKQQLQAAMECLDETMGIVPEGDVLLQSWQVQATPTDNDSQRDRLVHVDAIYLDRHPVTNEQFQKFVDAGGYENMSLWDAKIWPAVLDFVDSSGHPGPRWWEEGHFQEGREDHPVVGVSWYEGAAYARWAGKRLPSDPEWVKAGCWPVLTQGTKPMQRRYPWGDTMDRELAHVWGSGADSTISVYELPGGVSVGGIYHLIGNVWEWTTSNFGVWDATMRNLETPMPMKSIRGGAYDTYFDTQAMCQFQSGESPISRKHNIGFRCALSMCDVVSTDFEQPGAGQDELVACGADQKEALL